MTLTKPVKLAITGHPFRAFRQLSAELRLRHPRVPLRLHLGCGQRRLEGYLNIDGNYSAAVDWIGDIAKLPCPPKSVAVIESYHVIEHIPHNTVLSLISEWHRLLIPGGIVIVECPDLDRSIIEYLQGNAERIYSIFGRQRFSGDVHYFGYNEVRLRALFEATGFSTIKCGRGTDYHADHEPCLRLEAVK